MLECRDDRGEVRGEKENPVRDKLSVEMQFCSFGVLQSCSLAVLQSRSP